MAEAKRQLIKDDAERKRLTARLAEALRRGDERPKLVLAAKLARELLPGDSEYGDPLSTAGGEPAQQLGRRLSMLSAERPSLLGEIGLSALQVWESLSEPAARPSERELAILFTDLVEFSSWSLRAGDAAAVELLRQVGAAIEPAITHHDGVVVKRLGDGLMAAFEEPRDAVEAAIEARESLSDVEVDGHRPKMRAGIHVGHPQRLGGDYLGNDVNIAARVADAARGDEILISSPVRERLGAAPLRFRRRRGFRAKGAPKDLGVYVVTG